MDLSEVRVVIPARLASSRLPEKVLLPIDGLPIFIHVYNRCVEAGIPKDQIFVAVDDEAVAKEAAKANIPTVFTSKELASGSDRVSSVCQHMGWPDHYTVINVQGDEPEMPPEVIRGLLDHTLGSLADIVTVYEPIRTKDEYIDPNVVKVVVGEDHRAVYFSRSQVPHFRDGDFFDDSMEYNWIDCPLRRHIGIYAYSVGSLKRFCALKVSALELFEKLEQLRALANGMSIEAYQAECHVPPGIDTQEDFIKAVERMVHDR